MKDVILYRYFDNEADADEIRQIEAWLAADPEHQREFDAAHMIYNALLLEQARRAAAADAGEAADGKFREGVLARRAQGRLFRLGRMALRVAAAVVLVVGAGYFGSRVGEQRLGQTMAGRRSVIEVPAGQRISVTLQDGTCVCLNGGSRLEYPVLFAGEQRRVKLSGEALLEVAHDASCPFVVETFASEIEVLGTTFNVYADEAGRHFSTTLVEGCVQVRNLLSKNLEQHILSPDESVRLVDGHLEHHHVTAADALCWTQGYINIRGVGFDELMRRFENTYGVRIEIARETLPAIGYLSGKIQVSEGVDFALSLLQQACDFRYTKDPESGTITIL